MSPLAKVTSIDAVQTLASAIVSFIEEVTATLDYLDLQIKRATQWLGYDRKEFWHNEVRQGWDRVAQARAELERCLTFRKAGDHQSACIDEKKKMEQVQRRLRVAQEKIQVVRRWQHVIDRHVLDCVGSVSQVTDWVQGELPKALAALERMTDALQTYVAVEVAPAGGPEGQTSAARSAATDAAEAIEEEATTGPQQPADESAELSADSVPEESQDDASMGSDDPGGPTEAGTERPSGSQE